MASSTRELTWFSRHQPDTLRAAVVLLYLNAGLSALYALFVAAGISSALLFVDLLAGVAIANHKRIGFALGLAAAIVPIVLFFAALSAGSLLNLLFWLALLALLLHPHSRHYVRTSFR